MKQIDEGKPMQIFGDGAQSRDFTYVDDIAKGTVLAIKKVGFRIINLGGNHPHGLMDMVGLIEKNLGKRSRIVHKPFHKADIKATWANINEAKKVLGWKPKVSLAEGIKRTTDWYLANRRWLKNIKLDT
jgi:nucleoside-diphosphate-sugar epimerase